MPFLHRDIACGLIRLPLRERNDKLFMRQVLKDRAAEMGSVNRARKPQSYDPSKIFRDDNFKEIISWISEAGICIPSLLESKELMTVLTRLKDKHDERRFVPSVFSKQRVRAGIRAFSTSISWSSGFEWRVRERWFNSYTDAPALPNVAFRLCSLGATFSIGGDRSKILRQLYPVEQRAGTAPLRRA